MHCQKPSLLDGIVTFLATLAFILHTIGIIFPMWWTVHEEAWLIGPAVLVILADVLLFVVMVTTGWYLSHDKHGSLFRKLCVVLSAGGAGTIILALLIFFKKKTGLRPSDAPETTNGNPDWSFLMTMFGAIVAIFHSTACTVSVKRVHKTGSARKQKSKTIFGIDVDDLEIDVRALRRGELMFGKNVNMMSNAVTPKSSFSKNP